MSVTDIDRCAECGGPRPNGPTPMPGECSCVRCEECGAIINPGDGYCVPCDNRTPDEPQGGPVAGEFEARMASYQRDLKR